jgi:hypothetical protein
MATTKTLSAAELTKQQELGSAWIFRRALKDNVRYNKWEDILNDPKYDELGGEKGIYPSVDKVWLQTFYLQQAKMLEEFSNVRFTEFNRDNGFMSFITNLVKSKFGIAKKDSWNPADIWCIKDEKKVIADINKVVQKGHIEELGELNALLRTLFRERRIVGISLKKVSGKQAKYEEVNVDTGLEYLNEDYTFDVSKVKIDLSLKPGNQIKLSTQDTTIFVDAAENGKKVIYKYQITTISSSRFNNLKWEPTSNAASAARLGKAPVAMVLGALSDFKINFSNSNSDYPKSAEEFKKRQKEFVTMFNAVKIKADTVITDDKLFVSNMTKVFMESPQLANTKLMQLAFVYQITKLPKKQMDALMTKITLLAQKKGLQFGPFGKLY